MLRVLEGPLSIEDMSGSNIFAYDTATRKRIYEEVLNQQNEQLKTIPDEK